jgi:hypothetical protein
MPRAGYFGSAPAKGFNWLKICRSKFFTVIPSRYLQGITDVFSIFYLEDILLLLVRYHIKKGSKKQHGHFKNEKKILAPKYGHCLQFVPI